MREVCFLVGTNNEVLWSDASNNPSAMPDSRRRWQAIWDLREKLAEIAHSHPNGLAAFSQTDESTMEALNGALGRAPRYSIVTPSVTVLRIGDETSTVDRECEPWWADLLRLASGIPVERPTKERPAKERNQESQREEEE